MSQNKLHLKAYYMSYLIHYTMKYIYNIHIFIIYRDTKSRLLELKSNSSGSQNNFGHQKDPLKVQI